VSTCFIRANGLQGRQAERFLPPYYFEPLASRRPNITTAPASAVPMGGAFTVAYSGAATHAVLMAPAAVTHQNNMNQRGVRLAMTANGGGSMTVVMPPNGSVLPAGWCVLCMFVRVVYGLSLFCSFYTHRLP
jgi:hypothetical protein